MNTQAFGLFLPAVFLDNIFIPQNMLRVLRFYKAIVRHRHREE
jgi:hypothetical protein